ncbi:MAG TPA: ATP-binding protein [Candidatus Polarisedimenticolia bacterium]|nr:ATP-binding protein [Candidatus Polarisedimenticolia bacterium]
MHLTIARIVAILLGVMILLFAFWEGVEELARASRLDGPLFYLVRGVTTAVFMTGLTAWLMILYRRRYENDLRRASQQAHRTKAFFENIVQDAGEAIISLDNDGRVTSWNKAAERMYGFTETEMLGRSLEPIVPPDLLAAGELERIVGEVRRDGCIRNLETRRRRKEGSIILVRLTRTLLKDSEGRITGTSAIVSDITAQNEMASRLLQAEKLAAIGQAAASTAHEVRNALAGIWGTIQVLERTSAWRELPQEVSDEVHLQIGRIGHIIDDLLSYARPGRPACTEADINAVVERAIEAASSSPDARDRLVVRLFSEGPLSAEVDPRLIEQALHNLILNACQAMDPGGILRIGTAVSAGRVVVRLVDDGPGMTAEELSRAFEPFYTTKARGTGLGLPIVKTIVEAHGGTILLASEPGKGTTVTVGLPGTPAGARGEPAAPPRAA